MSTKEKNIAAIEKRNAIIEEMFLAGLLGSDRIKMLERLKRANRIAIGISGVGISLGMTLMLFPSLLFVSMVIKATCFWVGMAMVLFSKGLYTIKPRGDDPHPSVFYAMFWPTIVGCWSAYKIMPTYVNMILPLIEIFFCGILLVGLMFLIDKSFRHNKFLVLWMFFILGLPYAYGVITFYNVSLDASPAINYEVKITQKTNTDIQLEQWGECEKGRKIKLSNEKWEDFKVGDLISIEQHAGFLGNHWFKVKETIPKVN